MKYSLVNVSAEKDGYVDGVWICNYTGTLIGAIKEARDTEKANSNRIKVAVVDDISCPSPNNDLRKHLKRLDTVADNEQNLDLCRENEGY